MMVSMDDVAAACGVSKATVSRVLNRKGVGGKTREKVMKACEKLGYQLNPGIQDLVLKSRTGNTRRLALVLIDIPFNSAPYVSLINELILSVNKCGYNLSFVNIDSTRCKSLYELPAEIRDRRVDGMFLTGSFPENMASLLRKLGLPGVLIGCFRQDLCEGFCNIHEDFYMKNREVIQNLTERGAKRIAYVEEFHNLESDSQKFAAFCEAHKAILGDFDPKLHFIGKVKLAGLLETMTPVFLKKDLSFDAIYSPDERIAIEMDKLNFMHSKLFSVPMLPQATSWLSHDSVLEKSVICCEKRGCWDIAVKTMEDMIEKRPWPGRILL